MGIGDAGEEEVGIRRIDLIAYRQLGKGFHHAATFLKNHVHPPLHVKTVVEHLHGLLLREQVHVVGIFHLVHQGDDFLRGKGHAQTDGCRCPSLAHGVEHNEVGIFQQLITQGTLTGEVAVGLVDDDDTLEARQHINNLLTVNGIARGVVGAAYPDDLGVLIAGSQQLVGLYLELLVEQHGTILNIVDVGTYTIHAVGRLYGHHIVDARTAEDAVRQVDGLVATVAQEGVVGGDALHSLNLLLQFCLKRVGIAVQRVSVGILVSIEKHMSRVTGILVAGTTIGSKAPDVGAGEVFERLH